MSMKFTTITEHQICDWLDVPNIKCLEWECLEEKEFETFSAAYAYRKLKIKNEIQRLEQDPNTVWCGIDGADWILIYQTKDDIRNNRVQRLLVFLNW